jgi:hypothetical protein
MNMNTKLNDQHGKQKGKKKGGRDRNEGDGATGQVPHRLFHACLLASCIVSRRRVTHPLTSKQ